MPPDEERRLRLPAARAEVAQEHRQGRGHPAARRAVPRQRRGDIRRNLVKRGFIKGIIGLPPNLFYGTGIPACIVVLDKENAQRRTGIFMIDATKGFMKDGNKNRLRAQDIHKIVDVFNQQIELPRYSRMVPLSEIARPERLQPQHPALHRLLRARGPARPRRAPARRHSQTATSTCSAPTGASSRRLRAELFRTGDRPGY